MDDQSTEEVSRDSLKVWAVIALLFALLAYGVVDHLSDDGRARAAGTAVGLLILAGRTYWHQRRRIWFWVVTSILASIHAALVVLVPWSKRSLPAPEFWPIGMVDFIAIFGTFELVQKLLSRKTKGGLPVDSNADN